MKLLVAKIKKLLMGVLALAICIASVFTFLNRGQENRITVGAKNCTEQHVLAEILATLIEVKTDIKVRRSFNFEGTTICFNALKSGSIDLYIEYTGTALLDILKEPLREEEIFPYVKKAFEDRFHLKWLGCLGFSNQYVLIARKDWGIKNISDIDPEARIALDPEFQAREELALLKAQYGHPFEGTLMDQILLYFSLKNGNVDLISGFSTDGRLEDDTFQVLEDDLRCLPSYEAAPIIRPVVLERFPQLEAVIGLLEGTLTEEEMRRMNHLVEFEGCSAKEVAQEFVKSRLLEAS